MVDVSAKTESVREALAAVDIEVGSQLQQQILSGDLPKGDVLAVVRVAAIQASKRCSDLIPLCHPLPLEKVAVDIQPLGNSQIQIQVTCRTTGRTGVEMEALTAASIGALTLYDMCKAVNRGILINNLRLLEKSGGKSGDWTADEVEG